jgi:hypothetical protein
MKYGYEAHLTLALTVPVPDELVEATRLPYDPGEICRDHEAIIAALLKSPDALETLVTAITDADIRPCHHE